MNDVHTNGSAPHSLFERVPLPLKDFHVSWVGPAPSPAYFCLGSEDGRLLFTDELFTPLIAPGKASISGEAINGVAYSGAYIAFTTRADLTMARMDGTMIVAPHGAHGVAATPSGCFAAAMGRDGFGMLRADSVPRSAVGMFASGKEGLYVHRVIAQRGRNEADLLVCAAGHAGIGITEVRWGEKTFDMRVAPFEGVDVVDVCPVDSDPRSPAVAAVGRDGTLIVVRDAFHDSKAASIKFKAIQGTAYRLLSRGEDILLLTSRALYVLKNLAVRLATGVSEEKLLTDILKIPMEAVDANIAHDRWLLIVTPDEVLKGDLDLIHQGEPDLAGAQVEVTTRTPTLNWQSHPSIASELASAAVAG